MAVADATLERIAADLAAAYVTGVPVSPVRDALGEGGIDAAYRVQLLQTRQWVADGRRIVGRKIGLTSEVVQRQLGVDQPDFGVLLADMCLTSGEPVPVGAVLQPRVEAEVALVVNRDLVEPDLTIGELLRAIEFVLPAIEVVGSRIEGWNISILDTVADNASSGMFVLGTRPMKPGDLELRDLTMELSIDGALVSSGVGSACLGHPYRAALWLARRLAGAETPLLAGDVVMTGALGPMVPLAPGAQVVATIEGLGTVHTAGGEVPA
jgi:2-keto-4-pentenoate hydratase